MRSPVRPAADRAPRSLAIAVLPTLIVAACAGCFNPFSPDLGTRKAVYIPPPNRDTAQGVVELLKWAYDRRDYQVYRTLFTEDYRFYFAPNDTAGNSYRDQPWIRDYELESAQHLFEGGSATQPPASSIDLTYNGLFVTDTGDTILDKDPQQRYRRVSTAVTLNIRASGGSIQVQGNAEFYVVRYSAAKIPADISNRVSPGDWLIYGWVDLTLPPNQGVVADAMRSMALAATSERLGAPPDATASPNLSVSWGAVKVGWR